MKLYRNFLALAVTAMMGIGFSSCSDDDSLENAGDVYIDIMPESITMYVGDSIPVSATVVNTAGKIIKTPVEFSLDDESVVNLVGDTLVCMAGALDRGSSESYKTNLRATLVNGKYALATVEVRPAVPDGVTPDKETQYSYYSQGDVAWFTISPKRLLQDYEPKVELSNDQITLCDPALTIDYYTGRVGVRFDSERKSGECVITLSIGSGADVKKGSCKIIMQPQTEASLWDPGTGTGINDLEIRRMSMGELPMYRTYNLTKTVDINSVSYVYAGVNVPGGAEVDILQAMDLCGWEAVSGSSVLVTEMKDSFIPDLGFDAILRVASGAMEGTSVFNFVAPDTVLEMTFRVVDFNKQPVNAITTNAPEGGIEMVVGSIFSLETGVEPMTSFIYHRPTVEVEDTSIVKVGEYNSNIVQLSGMAEGQTNIILTAKDKTLTIPVKVNEGVRRIYYDASNAAAAFAGQEITWNVIVETTSGKPSTFPVTWTTTDETIATAAQGSDPYSEGNITAKTGGQVDVIATVLSLTAREEFKVINVPDDIVYNSDNTSGVLVNNSGNNLRIRFVGPAGESVEIQLVGYKGQYNFDISDMSVVTATYDGAPLAPTSGWLRGSDDGKYTHVSFELTFTIAGKTFTLSANDIVG